MLKVNNIHPRGKLLKIGRKVWQRNLERDVKKHLRPHGTISMRVSTSIRIISKAICLKVLKAMGMQNYIKTSENPNKDMLKTLSDLDLAKLSCERKTKDNVTIEPKIEEIITPQKTTKKKEAKK